MGLQPFQPGIGRTCVPVAFFPGADDQLAGSRSVDRLHGRYDGSYSVGIDETGDLRQYGRFKPDSDALSLLIGQNGGCLGEVSALALLIGLAYMLWKKIITWHIPVSILVTVFVFAGIMHLADPEKYVSPVLQLLSGGLMLGAVFMATDYVTSPMSKKGMLIYGVCIGLLTVVIRLFGAYPEGMSFAILIMNAFTPLINTYCKPKRFGEVAKKK
ncbi:RnfABCDGE type electron transport complex subunit D [Bacteroides caccae]|nr:RnfABCDGE type electron transport complex subunit D [Bacteroides caccae]